jgi:hypothetical protein
MKRNWTSWSSLLLRGCKESVNERQNARPSDRFQGRLQVLGDGQAPMPCVVEFVAGGRVRAVAGHPVRVGVPVMLDMQDRWLTAEVVSCRPLLEGYALSLHLHGDGAIRQREQT